MKMADAKPQNQGKVEGDIRYSDGCWTERRLKKEPRMFHQYFFDEAEVRPFKQLLLLDPYFSLFLKSIIRLPDSFRAGVD